MLHWHGADERPSLAVPKEVMHHVVRVESSFNPYAIGVVAASSRGQPRALPEALATVRMLETKGYNFSLGLAQVNRYNLEKYGLASYEQAFEVCPNLQTGSRILAECYSRSGGNWGKSFSCYYSGNFVTGYRHGYVQKIYASMRGSGDATAEAASDEAAIAVSGKPSRRVVEVTRFPVRASGATRVESVYRVEPLPSAGSVPTALQPPASSVQFVEQLAAPGPVDGPASQAAPVRAAQMRRYRMPRRPRTMLLFFDEPASALYAGGAFI